MHSQSHHTTQQGVTLIELMISLAIVSILILSVGPMMRDILIQNRLIGQINELSAVVQFARHTAVHEQATTVVCPSTNFITCDNDWNEAKMVFLDLNANGQRDVEEDIVAGAENTIDNFYLQGPAGVIRFQDNGAVATPATLLLCHNVNEARFARALTISLQGRVRLSRDSNNDNIHENNAGDALVCG